MLLFKIHPRNLFIAIPFYHIKFAYIFIPLRSVYRNHIHIFCIIRMPREVHEVYFSIAMFQTSFCQHGICQLGIFTSYPFCQLKKEITISHGCWIYSSLMITDTDSFVFVFLALGWFFLWNLNTCFQLILSFKGQYVLLISHSNTCQIIFSLFCHLFLIFNCTELGVVLLDIFKNTFLHQD